MINCFDNIIEINKNEVLRYLEYKGQFISDDLDRTIDTCIQITKDKINPRYILRVYPILRTEGNDKIQIVGTNVTLKGKNIYELLKSCDSCAIFATTLGINIEKEIRKNSYINLTESIIIDSCATTAIEEVCDIIQDRIYKDLNKQDRYITNRYSPGYGDLSLQTNRDIINMLNASKEIGLTITDKGIMLPRKSVTAIIGISQNKINKEKKSCSECENNINCKYKKGDDICEYKGIHKR